MLDHSSKSECHPSIMSIGRKWVSDTNLSRLLHETIEKKQANKQSKLPDFCKDAILSATIKKISSAMLIDQNSTCSQTNGPEMCEDLDQDLGVDVGLVLCDDISDIPWEDKCDVVMSLDNVETHDMDASTLQQPLAKLSSPSRTTRAPLQGQSTCHSPKRKRHPSHESMDDSGGFIYLKTVSHNASPCKKRRADFSKAKSCRCPSDNDNSWLEESSETVLCEHNALGHGMYAQRSQSLPHLTLLNKEDHDIIPHKNSSGSVVNSISELSINDTHKVMTDNSWLSPNAEPANSDPLELDGFFQELNTISVNPD